MTTISNGRVALVVGGARGIGAGIAARFLREGARVVIADIETATGEAAAAGLGAPDRVRFIATDITRKDQVEAAVAAAVDNFGALDILVQSAGIYPWTLIENTEPEEWDAVMASTFGGLTSPPARLWPR
jgi:3-oxoacyl-[acyl-carrier protein] reductase